ncbi:hypothetical protein DBR32_08060 [Taibaiella sp. KBW10]|nr:hypothetical protein DBR32_08060 [Taibaiella sp. KBW10]
MHAAYAQEPAPEKASRSHYANKKGKIGSVYMSTQMDGYILSTAMMEKGASTKWTTPRFTAFLHIGATAHINFNDNFGLFSGLGVKNIGFIEKFSGNDSTVKRRVYTIGIPLGIKVGNMSGTYAMLGGGLDIPFHFKEKGFVKRSSKVKQTEWFSQRNETLMPYVFVGAHFKPGVNLKLQYYPTNFLNTDFKQTVNNVTTQPYAGYKVNLAMVTLGIDIPYRPKFD